jgi:hypothetical protein
VNRGGLVPKYTRQEFKYPINGILMLLVSFPRSHSLLPQMLIRVFQLVQICRDGSLVALNGSDAAYDRVDI